MQLPFKPSAVVFDMDGLLFDTETLHREAIMAAALEFGSEMTAGLFARMLGGAWPKNRAQLLGHYGAGFPVDAFRDSWMRRFDAMVETRLELKPGALELLDALDKLGLPRAIATSSLPASVERHLRAFDLAGRFNVVVAQGDYAASKPAPDAYLMAAERLGVEPELCLALEDSFNGVRSASSASMMTVMVPDLQAPTDDIRLLCAAVVGDLHAVRRLVLNRWGHVA